VFDRRSQATEGFHQFPHAIRTAPCWIKQRINQNQPTFFAITDITIPYTTKLPTNEIDLHDLILIWLLRFWKNLATTQQAQ
jgi:hypothetical protein